MDRRIRALRRERCCRRVCRRVMAAWLGSLTTLLAVLQGGPLPAQAISPCQTASAPAAAFSVTCTSLSCTFNVTSSPPANAMFGWDFGDLTTALGPSTSMPHAYPAAGAYMVTLTVTDANGAVGMVSALVGVGSPGAPLAADDAFETDQDTPITIAIAELLANDAPGVSFVGFAPADAPKCYFAPGASDCTYTPASGFYGVATLSYSVQDALGNTGSATVWITVRRALVANPDYFTVAFDGSIQISTAQLLANDTPGALFVSAQDALNGTLSLVTPGPPAVYSFVVATGFAGDASFDYLISSDGNPPYALGVVTVTVVDAPPTANFAVSCVNRTCTVHPTSTDPDSTPIYRWLWNWGDGTPTIEPTMPYRWADQVHTYAASGRYTITHTVYDTAGQSGSLQLAVLANTPPIAANVTATTERDLPVTIDVLASASDPDGDPLSPGVNLSAYPGAASQPVQLPNGRWAIKVTPPDTFVGTMTFPYVVSDPWGATATATVTLTVTQWSVVVDALGQQFACYQNTSVRIPLATLLAIDYDSLGQTLTIVGFDTSVLMGTLDCTTDPTACTYSPPNNAVGFTFFRYTISDPVGREDTATVKIYVGSPPYGHPPTAVDDYFTTTWNTPKAFTIQDIVQNDVDPDGDTLSVGLQSGARPYGSLTCSNPMYTCTYTPNAGFVGADHFPYTASDGLNPASTAWINVLTLPPTTPTFDAREDVIVTGVNQPAYFSSGLLTNDYAPSGGPITVTALDTTGLIGTLGCNATSCTYYPPSNFQGTTTFKYTANDGHGATDTAIVKIKVGVTNHPPVAVPQTLSTPKNRMLRFSVFQLMQNDYDPDDDPLTVSVYTVTAHLGTLDCGTPNYWCTYTPNANTTGADVVTYALSDGTTSVTSTVTINITP
jgi:PKD repeat protein